MLYGLNLNCTIAKLMFFEEMITTLGLCLFVTVLRTVTFRALVYEL